MKKNLLLLSLLLSIAGLSSAVYAHDDATLDAMKTPHNGIMRMAGQYHFELVTKANEKNLIVYVTDHGGKEVSVASLKGNVMIVQNGSRVNLPLKPHASIKNAMVVSGNFDLKGSHVSVTIDNQTARFNPK